MHAVTAIPCPVAHKALLPRAAVVIQACCATGSQLKNLQPALASLSAFLSQLYIKNQHEE